MESAGEAKLDVSRLLRLSDNGTMASARQDKHQSHPPRDVEWENDQKYAGFRGSSPKRLTVTEHDGNATPLVGIDSPQEPQKAHNLIVQEWAVGDQKNGRHTNTQSSVVGAA